MLREGVEDKGLQNLPAQVQSLAIVTLKNAEVSLKGKRLLVSAWDEKFEKATCDLVDGSF